MSARNYPPRGRVTWPCAVALLSCGLAFAPPREAPAQTQVSQSESLSEHLQAKLRQKGTLILRDASLIESLFAIKENWDVNIVIPNDVKGAINGSFTDAPLHKILDAILASQGYGYRAIGESLVVMKLEEVGGMKPLFITEMLPLENVPPDEVVEVIKFMLSPNGKAHAVPTSKSLVVMDFADRIDLIRNRLKELDTAAKTAIDRAKELEAKEAEEEANRNQALQSRPAAPQSNSSGNANSGTPPMTDPSSSSATGGANGNSGSATSGVGTGSNATTPPGAGNISPTGVPGDAAPVSAPPGIGPGGPTLPGAEANTSPAQGASPLGPMGISDPLAGLQAPNLGDPSGTTGSGIGAGSLGASGATTGRASSGGAGAAPPADLEVAFFAPQFVSAASIAETLATLVSEFGQVSVVADENRVVAIDQPDYLKRISLAVEKLDIPRRQVRITSFIFDANMSDIETLGINWNSAFKGNNVDSEGAAQQLIRTTGVVGPTPAATALNGATTFMSLTNNVDVTAIVNALRTSSTSRLLADPTVVVMDHESARIATVTEIPYQELTQSALGGSIGTTAFREAGVTLEVTPRIARDGTVALVVTPTFSVLTGFTEGTNQPIIARREAQTVVRVANNQTLVIGGLRQRGKVRDRNAVPGLGDIKFIGGLFRYRKDEIRESELLVFLTPTIVPYDALGTLRENGAFESTKCELEKVRQEECYRCKEPEDRTIYTNPELGNVPVTVRDIDSPTPQPDVEVERTDGGDGKNSVRPESVLPDQEARRQYKPAAGRATRTASDGMSERDGSSRRGESRESRSVELHAAVPYNAPSHPARASQTTPTRDTSRVERPANTVPTPPAVTAVPPGTRGGAPGQPNATAAAGRPNRVASGSPQTASDNPRLGAPPTPSRAASVPPTAAPVKSAQKENSLKSFFRF